MTKARDRAVRLGYELGSGEAVDIPIRHMVVTGQTQEAGKTTTLEALVARSGVRALTFVTKPGERAFAGAARIPPYFREQSDWRFVAALLEAHMGERMKFERNWISRASEGTKTLEQVRQRAKQLAETARGGFNQDQFRMLGVYLDELVPAIAAVEWAPRLQLREGVNVVDVELLSPELQQLVIKSALDWVLKRERGVVVVVPEAWQFVPQGRNTPVKLSAQAYIRQGATLGNYLWLDSQDIGGVDKETLRQCGVWLLGVQREANEIKRTLENIPQTIRPKSNDVATLELGEFLACWGRHVRRVYVQPTWVSDSDAARVAQGLLERDVVILKAPAPRPPARHVVVEPKRAQPPVQLSRLDLRDDELQLEITGDQDVLDRVEQFIRRGLAAQRAVDEVIDTQRGGHSDGSDTRRTKNADRQARGAAGSTPARPGAHAQERHDGGAREQDRHTQRGGAHSVARAAAPGASTRSDAEGEPMNDAQERKFDQKFDTVIEGLGELVKVLRAKGATVTGDVSLVVPGSKVDRSRGAGAAAVPNGGTNAALPGPAEDLEAWLKSFPPGVLVQLRRVLPEIVVEVDRPVITADESTLRGRLALLIHEGFFDKNQTAGTVQQELTRRGFNAPAPNVSKEVGELARLRLLVRDNKWIRAVDGARDRVELKVRT